MPMSTPSLPVAFGIATAWISLAAWAGQAAGQVDPTPPGPDAPVQRVPYDPELSSKTIAFWESRAARDPRGAIARANLAGAYLARQRETGRIEDAVHAEQAARDSLDIDNRGNTTALTLLARALLTQHRFPEAMEVAERATALDPDAHRLRADILLELGDYDEAKHALAEIPEVPDDLNLLALRSRFAELEGENDRAIALLRDAGRLADALPDMPLESAAWYHTMVGHRLIDTGRLDLGEAACRRALELFPSDYRAMTGMAEAASWRGDWSQAARWAGKAVETSSENPEALRLLGEALENLGDAEGADRAFDRLRGLCHSFPRIYDRHWALFCADRGLDLDEALELARDDLQLRHDVHAHDTLAWVSFKKGLQEIAETEMDLALGLGTVDASMLQHAATITRAAGDDQRAARLSAEVRAMNPYLADAEDQASDQR